MKVRHTENRQNRLKKMLDSQGMSHQINFYNTSELMYKSKEKDEKINPIQPLKVGH